MKTKEEIKTEATIFANLFIEKSIFDMNNKELKEARIKAKRESSIAIKQVISELDRIWDEFDKAKMHGSQNFVLTRLRELNLIATEINNL